MSYPTFVNGLNCGALKTKLLQDFQVPRWFTAAIKPFIEATQDQPSIETQYNVNTLFTNRAINLGLSDFKVLFLSGLYQRDGIKLFRSVPLVDSVIPRHITIDTTTLIFNVMDKTIKGERYAEWPDTRLHWQTVYLSAPVFRPRSSYQLNGMILTDAVSLCVVDEKAARYKKKSAKYNREVKRAQEVLKGKDQEHYFNEEEIIGTIKKRFYIL
jgi:hypothetical protein